MPCPSCKDDRVELAFEDKWCLTIDEYCNYDVKYCPYCGWALAPKKEPKCAACTREQLCMHCLNSGFWADEDKCPSCAANGHTSPWGVGQCEVCNENYFDSIQKIHNKFEHHPCEIYVRRKVVKALGAGPGSINDIQNRIVESGFNLIISDIKAAVLELIENKVVKVSQEGLYCLC